MSLTAGQTLQRTYEITRLIGVGGMGEVYEARHVRLAGRYAVKLLLASAASSSEAVTRFRREAEITSSLHHPNIVQVVDFDTTADGVPYLVMELLEGEDLAARMARVGALPLQLVASIVEQVASGLAAAHARGIVHRDLKPENIFLVQVEGTAAPVAKVLDFGISKVAQAGVALTQPLLLLGTPRYMAPEQATGHVHEADGLADEFSLATVTYEMLAGRPPFHGDSVDATLYQVVHEEPPPATSDPLVDAVIRRGLAKDPAARFPGIDAFAQALVRASAAGHPTSGRTGPTVDTPRPLESAPGGQAVPEAADPVVVPPRWGAEPPRRRRIVGVAVGTGAVLALALSWGVINGNASARAVGRSAAGTPGDRIHLASPSSGSVRGPLSPVPGGRTAAARRPPAQVRTTSRGSLIDDL